VQGIVPGRTAADASDTGLEAMAPVTDTTPKGRKVLEMTGKADHPSADDTGRTAGRNMPSRARSARNSQATPVPIGIDPSAPIPDPIADDTHVITAAAIPPDVLPRLLKTQVAYRQLVSSGLTGAEAAGLIGYVSGLPTNLSPWTMAQINRLLFLRAIYHDGAWGSAERRPAE
jgi:hypothetical protein